MTLSFVDPFDPLHRRFRLTAQVVDHPGAVPFGDPVIFLEGGDPLSQQTWTLCSMQVEFASPAEFELLKGVFPQHRLRAPAEVKS